MRFMRSMYTLISGGVAISTSLEVSANVAGNVIYKEVNIVYKGTSTSASNSRIDSMFIVQWADPDVGYPVDDLAGCDTTLNLGYAYNSKTVDRDYRGLGFFPAVGYAFLQGVSAFTGNPNDSALFNLKWRKGIKTCIHCGNKNLSEKIYKHQFCNDVCHRAYYDRIKELSIKRRKGEN